MIRSRRLEKRGPFSDTPCSVISTATRPGRRRRAVSATEAFLPRDRPLRGVGRLAAVDSGRLVVCARSVPVLVELPWRRAALAMWVCPAL
jgi:hypothetical protein